MSTTIVSLRHTRIGTFVAMIFAPGFTVIVKVLGVPTQVTPPKVELGVTVIVAVIGNNVGLIAVKPAIFPMPAAPNPIVGSLLVQLNVVVAVGLVKFTAAVVEPAHTVWFAIAFTVAVGLTVIVNVIAAPVQVPPGPVGVTVIVPDIGAAVPFVAVKLAMLPVPAAARPIAVLLFVQLNTVPATEPVNVTAALGLPAQSVWLPTPFTFAAGLTVIVNVIDVPTQVTPPLLYTGVTVIVAVTADPVLLIAVNDGTVPAPLDARPILVLLFVQLYTVPGALPVIVTAAVAWPLQTVWLAIAFTDGVGLTVTVKLLGTP